MSTKLFVLSGAPVHASGGETSSPGCAYLSGNVSPSLNAVEVSVIDRTAPRPPPRPPRPPPRPAGGPAGGFCASASDAMRIIAAAIANRVSLIGGLLVVRRLQLAP